ncbi:hypothetical protein ABEF83_06855 [Acinetobacter thermotolerans]|uniref:hypothetical protein n=1 Tax=Acinetobacter thermotolerans TaxID=3151487 RepID=UPI00325A6431
MPNAMSGIEASHDDYMGEYVNNTVKCDECGVILNNFKSHKTYRHKKISPQADFSLQV